MTKQGSVQNSKRRDLISSVLMVAGLVAGYGLGLYHFTRYLVPLGRQRKRRELFVGALKEIPVGTSLSVRDPRGGAINIVRISDDDPQHPERGFKALSSKCPHLGCRVHWVDSKEHFLCPCHEGIFDKEGIALSGPPAKERKNLSAYEIRIDPQAGWVFVMVTEEARYGV